MRTYYHPHTYGEMEESNKCLETYLCFFAFEKKHQWVQWFPLVEWWYNTKYHEETKMTLYQVVYGKQPPSITSFLPKASKF
jgi:hypothetical protein